MRAADGLVEEFGEFRERDGLRDVITFTEESKLADTDESAETDPLGKSEVF